MNNYINLKNFEKPDKDFIKDKECLICLESLDIESLDKIVKLPCNCTNSVYHINCIIILLQSGINKNFCPHCKKEYNIPRYNNESNISLIQVLQYEVVNDEINNNIRNIELFYIYVFHIITNSFLNLFNIGISIDYKNKKENTFLEALVVLFYIKLFLNFFIIIKVKKDETYIKDYLYYSYLFQILIFSLLVYFFNITHNDIKSLALLINNIIFCSGDLMFRLNIHYKILNRINDYLII